MCFLYNAVCSVIFNFAFLPLRQAVYFPLWVECPHIHRAKEFKGKIVIEADRLRPHMIRLGCRITPYFRRGINIFVGGTLIFKGRAKIGGSSSVEVYEGASLTIGNKFGANDGLRIVCSNKITIGENTSIGWNVSMYDTNFHPLGDAYTGKELCKMTSPIVIGKNNWIASDCHISKGFKTADDVVIAAGTNCSTRIRMKDQSLIGEKNPCEVLVEGVYKMF